MQDSPVQVGHVFVELPVRGLSAATPWYDQLLGAAADEGIWRLNAGASLRLVVDPQRAGHGTLRLSVEDLDAFPGAAQAVALTDPDGNTIVLQEALSTPDRGDFHLLVKQRELERDAAEAIRLLDAGFTALAQTLRTEGAEHQATAAEEASEHLRTSSPPDVQQLRVTLRMLPPRRADVDALGKQLDTLDVVLRRRQNLGRGERWVGT
jgi:hypothetical protein